MCIRDRSRAMTKVTYIARVPDALILAQSTDDSSTGDLEPQKRQAKQILRMLTHKSPPEMRIDAADHYFLYVIQDGCCFLTLSDGRYPKKLAISYLQDLAKEFNQLFGTRVETTTRPYAFQSEFERFMEATKKLYVDTRTQRNLHKLTEELNDVTQIMSRNINEVMQRGGKLEDLQKQSEYLSVEAGKYGDYTAKIKYYAMIKKAIPFAVVGSVVMFVGWYML
eukprot:TRINITY_DN1702_c0_g1_i1.p1 TRINITY_DN1702_c0_g1~~TRINITY_DN1702_c0_g1_i1.p1  ORF type:complete len:223 (-),score=61.56 TRINITY_DN1702_c0_g1_i1:408-1076(-)